MSPACQNTYELLDKLVETNDAIGLITLTKYIDSNLIFRYSSVDSIRWYINQTQYYLEPTDIWNVIRSENIDKINLILDHFGHDVYNLFSRYSWMYNVFKKTKPEITKLVTEYFVNM